jgi:hypothetical protein
LLSSAVAGSSTWSAASADTGAAFPGTNLTATSFKSWSLSRDPDPVETP